MYQPIQTDQTEILSMYSRNRALTNVRSVNQLNPGPGLHCVADIDMYSEFVITMIIPVVGLGLIFLIHKAWLWRIQRSATAADGSNDAEQGSLQDQAVGHEDADAMASRGARDFCIWLAIGWLFMVSQPSSQIRVITSNYWWCPRSQPAVLPQVYTILCRTTFQSFACMDIDLLESFHQNE